MKVTFIFFLVITPFIFLGCATPIRSPSGIHRAIANSDFHFELTSVDIKKNLYQFSYSKYGLDQNYNNSKDFSERLGNDLNPSQIEMAIARYLFARSQKGFALSHQESMDKALIRASTSGIKTGHLNEIIYSDNCLSDFSGHLTAQLLIAASTLKDPGLAYARFRVAYALASSDWGLDLSSRSAIGFAMSFLFRPLRQLFTYYNAYLLLREQGDCSREACMKKAGELTMNDVGQEQAALANPTSSVQAQSKK